MYIINSDNNQIIVSFNSNIINVLTSIGYDAMQKDEKNDLIVFLAIEMGKEITEITPDLILNHHKELKIKYLNQLCENAIEAGFTSSNGHTYRTNRDDQINMIGQKDVLVSDVNIINVMWKAEDVGGWIAHTREEWLTVYQEAFTHKQNQLVKYNQLKQEVINATTHDEILAINW